MRWRLTVQGWQNLVLSIMGIVVLTGAVTGGLLLNRTDQTSRELNYDIQPARVAASQLVAGNVVMMKHAESVPQCALAFARLFEEAGAPQGAYTNLFCSVEQIAKRTRISLVAQVGNVIAIMHAEVRQPAGGGQRLFGLAPQRLDRGPRRRVAQPSPGRRLCFLRLVHVAHDETHQRRQPVAMIDF